MRREAPGIEAALRKSLDYCGGARGRKRHVGLRRAYVIRVTNHPHLQGRVGVQELGDLG